MITIYQTRGGDFRVVDAARQNVGELLGITEDYEYYNDQYADPHSLVSVPVATGYANVTIRIRILTEDLPRLFPVRAQQPEPAWQRGERVKDRPKPEPKLDAKSPYKPVEVAEPQGRFGAVASVLRKKNNVDE